ncbi:MAG: hypothetical protein J0I77_08665 [Rudaea sp.]|uniref:hypothetical protein n=1 Tax=unclassified Rudaea TaxID=2627037 RepID=UPI0010F4BF0E|nr:MULTISPECIES: hypothetical protein [unclassified Rudaea]MBN8885777.1 hypothetical protein [Rudaea sp.]
MTLHDLSIRPRIDLLEDIFGAWRERIGADYEGYRNHVYRMVHCCGALHDCSAEDRDKIAIAGAFHDIGIWSDHTVDYLPPSVAQARAYLAGGPREAWSAEIERMIDLHHKLRRVRDDASPLVEAFRKADLVDFSLGVVRFGLPGSYIGELKAAFPNAGFHKRLVQLAGGWFRQHPLSAPPFLKW